MAEVPLVVGRVINLADRFGPGIVSRYRAGEFAGRGPVQFASETLSEGSRINWRGIGYAIGAGAVTGGFLGASAIGFKRLLNQDRMIEPGTEQYPKRRRIDSDIVPRRINFDSMADQLSVAAGNRTTSNRYVNKVKLKRGRIGRKLNKEHDEYVMRWQRIYKFGANDNSYPIDATEQSNVGTTIASWPTPQTPVNVALNTGRLMLSHVEDITVSGVSWSLMPGYLFDITSWTNSATEYQPPPMHRLAFDNLGNFRVVTVSSQGGDFSNAGVTWQPESGPSSTSLPYVEEQKALLSWTDIRLAMYGAKTRCSKIHVEFVQFNDKKYTVDMYPDGESVNNMSQIDRDDVNLFWLNEFKRLTFNPLVCNMFSRKKAIKVLRSETFCINAGDSTNEEVGPPCVHKQYFKRFNRLVNWKWITDNLTAQATKTNMDNPAYQISNDTQITNYANPKARVFMYIRCEDFEPVSGTKPLSISVNPNVTSIYTALPVATYPAQADGIRDLETAVIDTATNIIDNKAVVGYTPVHTGGTQTAYMPVLGTADPLYASDRHVSFDIIVRNKWRVQN